MATEVRVEANRRQFLVGLATVFGVAAAPTPIIKVLEAAHLTGPEINRIVFNLPHDNYFKRGDHCNINMGHAGTFTGFYDGHEWWGLLVGGKPLRAFDDALVTWDRYIQTWGV